MSKNPIKRIAEIDTLRGIAICGVVIIHTFGIYYVPHFFENRALLFTHIFVANIFDFAVPLFIFVSGYLLSTTYDPASRDLAFFGHRIRKIVPAYLLASIAYCLLGGIIDPKKVLTAVVLGQASFHLWFVPLIIQLYLLFPTIHRILGDKKNIRRDVSLLVIAYVLQILWTLYAAEADIGRTMHLDYKILFISHIFYFVLGMLGYRYNAIILSKKIATFSLPILLFILCSASISVLDAFQKMAHMLTGSTSSSMIEHAAIVSLTLRNAAIITLLTAFLTNWRVHELLYRTFKQLSENAYPIFLIHILFLHLYNYLYWFFSFDSARIAYSTVLTIAVLYTSYLSSIALKQTRLGRTIL